MLRFILILSMILYHSLTVATEFDKCVQMLIDLPNCMMEKFRDQTKDIQDKLKECKEDAECKMQYIICVQSKLALCDDEVIKKQVQEQLKSFLQ
ncbi:unnamed protein product [Schistosoma bovis]|nr:unnamed protein product [Schistosoma bovis]CAH8452839.1 unnamed protein product [Schistosoma bovis]